MFHSGDYLKAKKLYHEVLSQRPSEILNSKVLFRLGQIDYRNNSCATAISFFNFLLDKYPRTSLYHPARFRMAVCLFKMESYPEAAEIFANEVTTNPDAHHRWQSLFYLSQIDDKRMDFELAVDKLRRIYLESHEMELKEHAGQVIREIIHERLSREQIMSLNHKYQDHFPADLLLLELLSLYRAERDNTNYATTLNDFIRRFPAHPERAEVEAQLVRVPTAGSSLTRLGVVLPLTGKRALTGQRVLQGIQLAYNNLSPDEKKSIELVVRDSGAERPLKTVMEEMAKDPNMVGIIGPIMSDNVRESVPVIEKYQIPVFSPTASSPQLASLSSYIFRNALTREIQGKYLAEMAVNRLNLRRFVIMYPEETYGVELKDVFLNEVEALGGQVTAVVSYDRSQNDFRTQILEIGGVPDDDLKRRSLKMYSEEPESEKYQGPVPLSRPWIEKGLWNENEIEGLKVSLELSYDAIFIPGFYDKVGLIVPQLIFYNIDSVTLLGTNTWNSPELLKIAGKFLNDSGVFVDGFYLDSPQPGVRDFVERFKSSFGENPTILSAQSFDAAQIFFKLIREGAGNRIQIKDQLLAVKDYPGISGTTTILPSGDSEKSLYSLKIKGKKIVQLE